MTFDDWIEELNDEEADRYAYDSWLAELRQPRESRAEQPVLCIECHLPHYRAGDFCSNVCEALQDSGYIDYIHGENHSDRGLGW